jgi:hypothetical protein
MGYLYTAKEPLPTSEDVQEDSPTYPPGIDAPPEFGAFFIYKFVYQDYGNDVLATLRDLMNPEKIESLHFYLPEVWGTSYANQKAIVPSFYWKEKHVYAYDSGSNFSWLNGKPFQASYKYYEDGEWKTSESAIWWKMKWAGDTEEYCWYWWWNGNDWTEGQNVDEASERDEGLQNIIIPSDKPTIAEELANAELNNIVSSTYWEEATHPLPLPVVDPGFAQVSRVGFVINSPASYTSIVLTFSGLCLVNGSFQTKHSNALPDTWEDVIDCDEVLHEVIGDDEEKSLTVNPSLLTGTDPLFLWFITRADEEDDYTNANYKGFFWDFTVTLTDTDGEESTLSFEDISDAWKVDQKTKYMVKDSDPVEYREVTVTKLDDEEYEGA